MLGSIYVRVQDKENAKVIAERLVRRHPDSMTAIKLAGRAYWLNMEWGTWQSLLDANLQYRPNDRDLLLESANEAEAESDFPRARRTLHRILATGKGIAEDYNQYAWLSLFGDQVDEDAVAASQQAVLLTKNNNYAYLHTLACLNAANGQTAEARQLLLEAMSVAGLEEPDGATWFGFGRIYEQYGLTNAAIKAYRRVDDAACQVNNDSPRSLFPKNGVLRNYPCQPELSWATVRDAGPI